MNPVKMSVSVIVASLALAGSAIASDSTTKYLEHYKVLRKDIPLPVKVVAPTGLPASCKNTVVTFTMLIDQEGRPKNVAITSPASAELSRILVPVVSQWRFTPAQENGVPVARKVILPVQLREA